MSSKLLGGNRVILLISVLLFAVTIPVLHYRHQHPDITRPDTERISESLVKMEKELDEWTDSLVSEYQSDGSRFFNNRKSDEWCTKFNDRKYGLIIFKDGNPLFWTSNHYMKGQPISDTLPGYKVYFINNTWVLMRQRSYGDMQVSSFIELKSDYVISNQYFGKSFHPVFSISPSFSLTSIPDPSGDVVTDENGDFLFCLIPPSLSLIADQQTGNAASSLLISLLFVAFLLLLIYIYQVFSSVPGYRKTIFILLLLLVLVVFRALQTGFRFPSFLYDYDLFSPVLYASSKVLPSIGDLILNTLLFFFVALLFFKKSYPLRIEKPHLIYFVYFLFFILADLAGWILQSVIYHSGISVSLFNIIESDSNGLLILLVYSFLTGSLMLLLDKMNRLKYIPLRKHLFPVVLFLIQGVTGIIHYLFTGVIPEMIFYVFVYLLALFYYYLYYFRKQNVFANLLVLTIIMALFICIHFGYHSYQKNMMIRKTLAMGLSNEHDVVAEIQMEELSNRIQNDYILNELVQKPYENQENVFSYIKSNYVFGYWTKYELQTTICSPFDNLRIQQTGKLYPCYQYFEDMLKTSGMRVESSNFYYLDQGNGRINYLGVFEFEKENDSAANRLYIELNSLLQMHVLGYPDILIDKKLKRSETLDEYSYAIYRNGKLVSASGKYSYSMNARMFNNSKQEFSNMIQDPHSHLIYRPDSNTLIVLTSQRVRSYHYITLFAYIFTVFSFTFVLFYILMLIRDKGRFRMVTVKQRIRTSLISVFLFSLLLLGSVTIYYIVGKYRDKQKEAISEKMQSILIELSHKIGQKNVLTEDDKNAVTGMLVKFSNVFYTDIHLYNRQGILYASSRNDVFAKGLTGGLMHPAAYNEMLFQQKTEFVHQETIGNLTYYSGYVPFYNQQGQLLCYLNLPYFTRQSDLSREVSDFIVALINILLILFIIGIWLTWWLSDNITRPLAMIQQKMQNIRLGKPNETIQYGRMDEIGALVNEYNRMLEELEVSARMLAESERETAWREMAKQIAHEIKNPLTPMKISIQYLQKAHREKQPGWEELIDKFAVTLIEQIDSLSAIASEFSAFARMPFPTNDKVNMAELGKSLLTLYEHFEDTEMSLTLNNEEELWAVGDREHLLRMFNNLIKNSIQAIPPGRKGRIMIEMTGYPQEVMVKITDNGMGIPPDVQDKMYTPSFTTKSSGMGLGLAIVKRIVETMNGSIRFVTTEGQGTTFFIELPKS